MTAFEIPPASIRSALRNGAVGARIELPVIERPDRLLVRTSTHFFNTEEEVDRLADVLKRLLP